MSLTYRTDAPCVSPPDVVDAAYMWVENVSGTHNKVTVARRADRSTLLWVSDCLHCDSCTSGEMPRPPSGQAGETLGCCSGCGSDIPTTASHVPAWASTPGDDAERATARRLAAEYALMRLRLGAADTAAALLASESFTGALLSALNGDGDMWGDAVRLRDEFYRWAASVPATPPAGGPHPPHPVGPGLVARGNLRVAAIRRREEAPAETTDNTPAACVGLTARRGEAWRMRIVGSIDGVAYEREVSMQANISAALDGYVAALAAAAGRAGAVRLGDMGDVDVPRALRGFDATERRRQAAERRAAPPGTLDAVCGETVTCDLSSGRIVMFAAGAAEGVYSYDVEDLYGSADMVDDEYAHMALLCAAEHTAAATAEHNLISSLSTATPSFGMAL